MIDTQKYIELIKKSEMAKDLSKLHDIFETVSSLLLELKAYKRKSYHEMEKLEDLISIIFTACGNVHKNSHFRLSQVKK